MARGQAIKTDDDGQLAAGGDTKASKRRCVQSACVPCRKRKSKCDGGTPFCATCTAVYKTECHYDEASEGRRSKPTAVKRENPGSTPDASDNAEFLLRSIRSLPEADVTELIQQIRKEPRLDIGALADSWRKNVQLNVNTVSDNTSLANDLSVVLGKPSMTQTGDTRYFGHTSHLGLVPEDENYTASGPQKPLEQYNKGTWTTVTDDLDFVERLLYLYFQWSHPFYVIFSRECFYRDFRSGRQKYCSPLLVNAILAYACHFTDDPAGRTDPDNFRTAGDPFFAEARRLLYEDETPSLTTTQALCVMAIREPSAGRDSSGFMYVGRCMRMAVELGLHLNTTASPARPFTPSEIEVRKVTFWGCFVVDAVWSLCIGRISQLPRSAITLDKPILEESIGVTYGQSPYQLAPGTVTSRMFLQEFSTLSELVNDTNFMYYAPKERLTSRRLLEHYSKYQSWYKNLPPPLGLPDHLDIRPLPHIVVLHMLYYTVIVHLFRPMLKVELIQSTVRPRDICIESANKVTDLLRVYRKHYDMRACHLVLTHILLSVSIVHLLYSQDYETSSSNLVETLQGLEDLSICHYFGARSFKIVHQLASTWNLPWPEKLKLSKLIPKGDDAPLASPAIDSFFHTQSNAAAHETATNSFHPVPSPAFQSRRESLSMFANASPRNVPSKSDSPKKLPGHHPHQSANHSTSTPLSFNTSSAPAGPTQSHAARPTEPADTLFWTPIPGMGVPILHRNYQMSPMDLNTMLGHADDWVRFGRDGFKMSESWGAQVPIGFQGTGPGFAGIGQGGGDAEIAPSGPGFENSHSQWWPTEQGGVGEQ